MLIEGVSSDQFFKICMEIGKWSGAAIGGVITFFFTLNRIMGKRLFYSGAGEVVTDTKKVTEDVRDLIYELRENSKEEKEVFEELLTLQRNIAASNGTIVILLQTLIHKRA